MPTPPAESTSSLHRLTLWLEGANERIGALASWLTVLTVLICFSSVYLRYVLNVGSIWLQELYVWSHVLTIMLGSGYTLLSGGFVRVTIVYQHFSQRVQAWINLTGTILFLVPFVGLIYMHGWPFFINALRMNERSAYEGGMPMVWLLKSSLLVFAVLLSAQGLAMVLRALTLIREVTNKRDLPDKNHKPTALLIEQ